MTCALVPLIPNEDTAARRRWPVAGQGTASVSNRTVPGRPVDVRAGLIHVQGGGQHVVVEASIILISPATPAAAWVCPMLDLIDPSHSGCSAARLAP